MLSSFGSFGSEEGAEGVAEDLAEAVGGERRGLHGAKTVGHRRSQLLSAGELHLSRGGEVALEAHQHYGRGGAPVGDLGVPLGGDVGEGVLAGDRVADEEQIRLRVGQRPQAVVVLLPCRVPQAEVYGFSAHHKIGQKIFKPRRKKSITKKKTAEKISQEEKEWEARTMC